MSFFNAGNCMHDGCMPFIVSQSMFFGHLREVVEKLNDKVCDFITELQESEVKRRRSFDDAVGCVCRAIMDWNRVCYVGCLNVFQFNECNYVRGITVPDF